MIASRQAEDSRQRQRSTELSTSHGNCSNRCHGEGCLLYLDGCQLYNVCAMGVSLSAVGVFIQQVR
jgi:hypothetical protein